MVTRIGNSVKSSRKPSFIFIISNEIHSSIDLILTSPRLRGRQLEVMGTGKNGAREGDTRGEGAPAEKPKKGH